jgi:4'-phosphopantetheinyl transferase EntD
MSTPGSAAGTGVTASALRALFSSASYVAETAPRLVDDELFESEREYIRTSVPKRRAEFGAARLLAREGLRAMGAPLVALVPGEGGAPSWPAGVVGSITHTAGYCAVVMGRTPPLRSVGLDVETLQDLEAGIVDSILTPHERRWLDAQPSSRQSELTLVFFSAKEAFYKCQYPITKTFLEFGDVELEISTEDRRFVARASVPGLPPAVACLAGRFAFDEGRVLCGIELYST